MDSNEELENYQKDKVKDQIKSVVAVNYVIFDIWYFDIMNIVGIQTSIWHEPRHRF